jgi:hypothetical protein
MVAPRLHHVVFCVEAEHLEHAAGYWRELGISFEEVDLPGLGIRVLLDWTAGIELVCPADPTGTETERFRTFLAEEGEGVYSVVLRTGAVGGPLAVARAHGAQVRYQQHRESGPQVTDEVDLSPVFGMPVTLLATTKPD